jgi:CysZ protein
MLDALGKAFLQLADPRLRRAIWLTLLASLAVVGGLVLAAWLLLARLSLIGIAWIDTALDLLAGAGVLVVAWLLFPATISVVVGFFLEEVAAAVERRHYPDLPAARPQPVGEQVAAGLRFALVAIGVNLLALPLYLAGLFLPPLNVFVFYGLNGYLLGREFYELVALRRFDRRQVQILRRAHGGRSFLAGIVIAFLLTVPFVNLIAPVIATAFMLHLFEAWRRAEAATGTATTSPRGRMPRG